MATNEFTPFEIEVVNRILDGRDAVLEALSQQFKLATVESREYTGVGIYVNFSLPETIKGVDEQLGVKARFCFGDVGAKVDVQQEVGFLLWVIKGKLAFLEGYTYGDEKWPSTIAEYNLYYFGDNHDIEVLRKAWVS